MPDLNRKLLVISLDSASSKDALSLLHMPAFASLVRRGTLVTGVSSVFISNTYPAHASIVTGLHPKGHGVIENLLYQPEREKPDWRWKSSFIRAKTLYGEAKRAGFTTCSILWPVTAGADITWNMPEIFKVRRGQSQLLTSLKSGGKAFQLGMLARHGKKLFPIGQPALDNFAAAAACDVLRRKKPGLTLLHLTELDVMQHMYGPGSPEAHEALDRHELRLERILSAVKDSGESDNTDIIILGDHACLPVSRAVDLSEEAKSFNGKLGFLQAGGCAFLKVHDMSNRELLKDAAMMVKRLLTDSGSGVGRLLSSDEMDAGGFSGEYVCGLEAADGVCFGKKERMGQHGYALNHPDYTTFYLAVGRGIAPGNRLSGGCITDICPLAADLLGLEPWETDGKRKIPINSGELRHGGVTDGADLYFAQL